MTLQQIYNANESGLLLSMNIESYYKVQNSVLFLYLPFQIEKQNDQADENMEICLDPDMEESESESTDHEIIFDEEEMLTVRPKITARTLTHSTLNVGSLIKDLSDNAIKNHEQGTVKLMTLEAAKKYKVENLDVKKIFV